MVTFRDAIYTRDGRACQYCGTTTAAAYNIDHVIPQEWGGVTQAYNLVVACARCNTLKGCHSIWAPKNLDYITAGHDEWRTRIRVLAIPYGAVNVTVKDKRTRIASMPDYLRERAWVEFVQTYRPSSTDEYDYTPLTLIQLRGLAEELNIPLRRGSVHGELGNLIPLFHQLAAAAQDERRAALVALLRRRPTPAQENEG